MYIVTYVNENQNMETKTFDSIRAAKEFACECYILLSVADANGDTIYTGVNNNDGDRMFYSYMGE